MTRPKPRHDGRSSSVPQKKGARPPHRPDEAWHLDAKKSCSLDRKQSIFGAIHVRGWPVRGFRSCSDLFVNRHDIHVRQPRPALRPVRALPLFHVRRPDGLALGNLLRGAKTYLRWTRADRGRFVDPDLGRQGPADAHPTYEEDEVMPALPGPFLTRLAADPGRVSWPSFLAMAPRASGHHHRGAPVALRCS